MESQLGLFWKLQALGPYIFPDPFVWLFSSAAIEEGALLLGWL